jgi:transmembrane sensor
VDVNEINIGHSLYIASLIHRTRERKVLSVQEQHDLKEWLDAAVHNAALFDEVNDRRKLVALLKELPRPDTETTVKEIFKKLGLALPATTRALATTEASGTTEAPATTGKIHRLPAWARRVSVAAALALLLGGSWWFLNTGKTDRPQKVAVQTPDKQDVAPGGYHAVLTLSGGRQIFLDSAKTGTLALQGNATVEQRKNGELAYDRGQGARQKEILYNTLSTGRGNLYKLVLPDGTAVWLNSGSSLHYPTAFDGHDREVDLSGEAYFEVAENKDKPFIVHADKSTIAVLGTHFDIQNYSDEPALQATLVQGSVRVSAGSDSRILAPGQQASILPDGVWKVAEDANIEEVLGWKEGMFVFDHTDLQTGMREIARWYDVEVNYEGSAPAAKDRKMIGSAPRNENLSVLIRLLNLSGIHCRLEGRTIIVTT